MPDKGTSFLLLEEYFAREDSQFLAALRTADQPKRLAAFADRWKSDPRPWARDQVLTYLEAPLNAPGHQPIVKRLFKEAQRRNDDTQMGAFLVAFDAQVRRVRRTRWTWDPEARAAVEIEELKTPRNVLPTPKRVAKNAKTGEVTYSTPSGAHRKGALLFSHRTRYYLRRRAWRYFRKIGAAAIAPGGRLDLDRATRYVTAVAALLRRYTDEPLQSGEDILDSWCLLQIAFRGSPALRFTPTKVQLADGHSLAELAAAPRFLALWKTPAGGNALLDLLAAARTRLVRVWARQLLEREHAEFLQTLAPAQLFPLLESPDEEVQQFAAGLLKNLRGLETLPVTEWLRILQTKNALALEILVEALREKVAPDRFSLEQLVTLATSVPAAVARLGLDFLKLRRFETPAELDLAARLSHAQSPALAAEVARFGLSLVARPGVYSLDRVSMFFDALQKEVRIAAWEILTPNTPGATSGASAYDDPELWARLIESPYEDVRLRLVEILEKRHREHIGGAALAALTADHMASVWTAVLLGVHRGGRHKIKALAQISREILAHAGHAERLLPVVAVAIRSVRAPEARTGLAAVVGLLARRPELTPLVERHLPEMTLLPTLETSA